MSQSETKSTNPVTVVYQGFCVSFSQYLKAFLNSRLIEFVKYLKTQGAPSIFACKSTQFTVYFIQNFCKDICMQYLTYHPVSDCTEYCDWHDAEG